MSEIQNFCIETKFPTLQAFTGVLRNNLSLEGYTANTDHLVNCQQDQENTSKPKQLPIRIIFQPIFLNFSLQLTKYKHPTTPTPFPQTPSRLTYNWPIVRYLEVTYYFDYIKYDNPGHGKSQKRKLCKHHFYYSFPTVTLSALRRVLQMSPLQ